MKTWNYKYTKKRKSLDFSSSLMLFNESLNITFDVLPPQQHMIKKYFLFLFLKAKGKSHKSWPG